MLPKYTSFLFKDVSVKLKRYVLGIACCLLLTSHQTLNAQITPTDSLELAFKQAKTDSAKLGVLLHDSPLTYLAQSDKLLVLYQQGLDIAIRTQDRKKCCQAAFAIATTYLYGKSDEGSAFHWFQKSLDYAEEIRNFGAVSNTYYALGIIYHHQGNRAKMYESFLKAIEYDKKATIFESSPYEACIINYTEDNRLDEAIVIGQQALEQADNRGADIKNKINIYANLLSAMKKMPNQKQALGFYHKKIVALLDSVALQTNFISDINYLNVLASISADNDRHDLAIRLANRVLNFKGEDILTLSEHSNAYEILATAYERQKNYPLSIAYLKKWTQLKQACDEKRMTENAGVKIAKAESERDSLLKQREVDSQKWLAILGFSIAALMLMGGVVVFRFYKREQERKRELATLNATKDKLFSIIAHDLRSPIGTLKTYLELTEFGMLSQAQFATASQKLTNNVNALFQTLDNLLHWAYSQLKGIKAKPENTHLHDVVGEELSFLAGIAQHKQITIVNSIDSDARVFADRNQVGLTIRNVLSNSLKFTPTGGKIVLESVYTEGSLTTLTITDNGIGMSESIKNQLFTIEGNDSRQGTASEKGQGLGLILVKEMIEANHGTLLVESTENQGTTVIIALPTHQIS